MELTVEEVESDWVEDVEVPVLVWTMT